MYKVNGGCHCGNIRLELELTSAPATYRPRACDCDFCRKHAAAYISDPGGSLVIRIRDSRELRRYRQGAGLAEYLFCASCGVFVGVVYSDEGKLYGSVNARAVGTGEAFGPEQVVSPKQLSADEKSRRWRDIWFAKVEVQAASASK